MTLWAIIMVKDELDVLPYTLKHLDTEGVTGIIVADNLSTDGTWEWLQDAGGDLTCRLVVQRDHDVGYYQSQKMTALAQQAFSEGAEWVLPVDADELWYCAAWPVSLAQAVIGCGGDCLEAPLHNYYPTSLDDPSEQNPFRRIRHRDPLLNPLPKVAVHNRPDVVIEQGNHGAHGEGPFVARHSTLEIAHFPWRSPEQFESKVRNGYAAYAATDLPADIGAHWRQYGEILKQGGPAALRDVYDTWFHDPDKTLKEHPAPWARFTPTIPLGDASYLA